MPAFVCQLLMERLSLGLASNGSNGRLLSSYLCPAPVAKQQSDPQMPEPFSAISTLAQPDFQHPLCVLVPPLLSPFVGPTLLPALWKMWFQVRSLHAPYVMLCHHAHFHSDMGTSCGRSTKAVPLSTSAFS